MKKKKFFMIIVFFIVGIMPLLAWAAVPTKVNYQGMLYDSSSNPITNTSPGVNIDFYIYDVQTGGIPLWSDSITGISVSNGLFNTELGTALNPLSASLFTGASAWLEIAVNGDPPMTPRQEITSVIFALRAGTADLALIANDANTVNGSPASVLEESLEIVNAVTAHKNFPSDHHTKTTSFTDLTDTASDGQIPAGVARDTEIMPAVLAGDGPGSGVDADLLDGQNSSAYSLSGHNHDTTYYTQTQVDAIIAAQNAVVTAQDARIAALEAKLTHFSTVGNDITISGANLNIVSGSGTTGGAVNSLGNLIVGYNELRGGGDDRSGSHNIIVGRGNNFSSYGGLVAGMTNAISNTYASVSGGTTNTASGPFASVSGGSGNTASGDYSSISGGVNNTASGVSSSVSGGFINTASGALSSVIGGFANTASGIYSSISGGSYNQSLGNASSVAGGGSYSPSNGNKAFANFSSVLGGAMNIAGDPLLANASIGENSTVSGGANNTANGDFSSVSGGTNNKAQGVDSSVSGGDGNQAIGTSSSVTGGQINTSNGNYSSVSGGKNNQAMGSFSLVAGGGGSLAVDGNKAFANFSAVLGGSKNIAGDPLLSNNTMGEQSTVSGGANNTAKGDNSSVSGGSYNQAMGSFSLVAGGGGSLTADGNKAFANFSAVLGGSKNIAGDPLLANNTIGEQSTVSGGSNNTAKGNYSSVSGGYLNSASGSFSSVSGGQSNTASITSSSVSGGYLNSASGSYSSVSGGRNDSVTGIYDWRAGDTYFATQ